MDQGETVVITKPTSNSPWGRTPAVAACSLSTVMDEQLAKDLQDKEEDLTLGLHVDLPFGGEYLIPLYYGGII